MKLITCISTCIIIFLCSKQAELSTWFVGFALMLGLSIHLIYSLILKFQSQNPKISRWLFLLPFFVLIILIMSLPAQHQLMLSIQTIGFSALGFFIISLYENRAPR